jgi:hypothetical protein
MKTATIQHATGDGTWESQYGLMYSYELHLSNGEHVKVNAKKPDAFRNGQEINYELTGKTDKNQTPLAKIVTPFNKGAASQWIIPPVAPAPAQPAGGKDRSILIQVAFKMAMDRINADPTRQLQELYQMAKLIYTDLTAAHEQF